MKVEILFFGQLVDRTQCNKLVVENPGSISALRAMVEEQFPALAQATFTIALNNKMVASDEQIPENAIIAFLPPFSGG